MKNPIEEVKHGITLDDLRPIARKIVGIDSFDDFDDVMQEMAFAILLTDAGNTRSWYLDNAKYAGIKYFNRENQHHLSEVLVFDSVDDPLFEYS